MTLKSSLDSHISVLAQCVVKLPPRAGVVFVESHMPNTRGEYEIRFREEAGGSVESIIVPVEMAYAAIASKDSTQLLAYISARYAMLFRKSMADEAVRDTPHQPEALPE